MTLVDLVFDGIFSTFDTVSLNFQLKSQCVAKTNKYCTGCLQAL